MKNKDLENLPFQESMSAIRQVGYDRKRHGSYYHGRIVRLLKSYIGRNFSDFYFKVRPLIKSESKPMTYILDFWFDESSFYPYNFSIKNDIIVSNKSKKHIKLPANVFFKDNIYYLVTEESKVSNAIYYDNGFIINPEFKSEYSWGSGKKSINFKNFYNYFEKGSELPRA